MAIYFDQNGNLVDTEINESSNVFMEDPTENFYQPRMDISPTQDFYQPQMDISATQDFYQPQMDISPNQDYYAQRNFINPPQDYYQPNLNTLAGLNMNKFQGVSDMSVIDETTNDEQDQNYINQVSQNNESGIMRLLKSLPTFTNLAAKILPQSTPEAIAMRNFYGSQYGLTPTGSVASGIMKGYNPISGGFLNMISGGQMGQPAKVGLAGAIQRRIEKILGRKAPQTDASRDKVAELQGLQLAEIRDRLKTGESLGSIGASTFSGPGMAFEAGNTDQGGGFTGGQVKDTGGVPGGKYGSPR